MQMSDVLFARRRDGEIHALREGLRINILLYRIFSKV